MQEEGNIESPYVGRDFVQFGKTKSVLNKGAQEDALLFNTPSVLSLEIIRNQYSFHRKILSGIVADKSSRKSGKGK